MAKQQQTQDRSATTGNSATVNTWNYLRPGHRGQNYAGMGVDDFPDEITLNVPAEGISVRDFAVSTANELSVQRAWQATTTKAQTAKMAADASKATAEAVQSEIGAAIGWEGVRGAKINLETARVNTQIAAVGLNIRQIELDVVEYQRDIALVSAPVRKGNMLLGALNFEQQFLQSATQLIQSKADLEIQATVLGIGGYDTGAIPAAINSSSFSLPTFNLPSLDQIMATTARPVEVSRD